MEIVQLLFAIFKLALIPTLFMFLSFNATRSLSKRNRYIVLSVVSFVLLLAFVISFIADCVLPQGNVDSYFSPFIYYVLIITSGFYFVLSFVFFIINFKNNEKFYKAKKVTKKMIYTVRPKEDYIYVFYRYQDNIYLLKDTHSGIKYKLKRTEFSDDALKKVNEQVKINDIEEVDRNGMVTVDMGSHDDVFYCYMIDLSYPLECDYLDAINMSDIDKANLMDFDKFVVLNCLLKQNFDERY